MKTNLLKFLILICLLQMNWRVSGQTNNYLTISNAPYTDTENGKVTFDYLSANAVSWIWYRIIDDAEILSRADDLSNISGATYAPARVGKYVLKYFTASNSGGVINFDVDIKDPNPCPNGPTNINQQIYYSPNLNSTINLGNYSISPNHGGVYPFTYQWVFVSNNNVWLNLTSTQNSLNDIEITRTAYVLITDANGCTAVVKSEISGYIQPPSPPAPPMPNIDPNQQFDCSKSDVKLKVDYIMTDSVAYSGRIEAHGTGGTKPYLYSLNSMTYSSDSVFLNIDQNCYTVKMKDSLGCVRDTFLMINLKPTKNPCDTSHLTYQILSIPSDTVNCDGELKILVSGGAKPYNCYWNNQFIFDDTLTISHLCKANFSLLISDDKGCMTVINDSSKIVYPVINSTAKNEEIQLQESEITIYPNPFSEAVFIESNKEKINSFKILDLSGKIILEDRIQTSKFNINTSFLEYGSYLLLLESNSGGISKKIVKY